MPNQQSFAVSRDVHDVMSIATLNTVLQVERQARARDRVRLIAIARTLREIARR